jgi:GNAT superfamily N-acetyltransferase
MLADGYSEVPAGKLAAVVTCLEMMAPPPRGRDPEQPGIALEHMKAPDVAWYRDLYGRIGTEWLWASRLELADDALKAIIHDPAIEVHAVTKDGRAEGLLELDFREEGICELTFFGLTPVVIGNGTGRWLMNRAISRAWSGHQGKPINRFWVHTCNLDHPQALGFYIRSGFTPFKRMVEVFDDPRLNGVLPPDAASHVPVLKQG